MGIKDIPDTLEGLAAWSKVRFVPPSIVLAQQEEQAYEETYMVPADTNKEVAGHTIEELLNPIPETFGLKAFGKRVMICLMGDIVRESTSCVLHIYKHYPTIRSYHLRRYPKQPWFLHKFSEGFLGLVAFIQRWFIFPRSQAIAIAAIAPTFHQHHEKFSIMPKLPKVDEKVRSPRLHPNE